MQKIKKYQQQNFTQLFLNKVTLNYILLKIKDLKTNSVDPANVYRPCLQIQFLRLTVSVNFDVIGFFSKYSKTVNIFHYPFYFI